MTGSDPARGARRSGAGDLGSGWRGPVGMRSRAGTLQAAASVSRREKPGQTRSRRRDMQPSRAATGGLRGRSPYTARLVTRRPMLRVSLRDRRDARPHADHLLRHPDLHRPAVQGPAAVDGAHAGARPVRPGRQADARASTPTSAATSSCSTRRADWVQADGTPFIKRVIGARRRHGRDPRRRASSSTAPSSTSRYTLRPARRARPSRRRSRATSTAGSSRRASSS